VPCMTDTQPARLRCLRDAAGGHRRKGPRVPPNPTTEELLDLLAAILDTLTIEPPTTGEDDASRRALAVQEHGRLPVHRALLVHVALENFQRDPDAYPAARTAAWLREQAAIAAVTSDAQRPRVGQLLDDGGRDRREGAAVQVGAPRPGACISPSERAGRSRSRRPGPRPAGMAPRRLLPAGGGGRRQPGSVVDGAGPLVPSGRDRHGQRAFGQPGRERRPGAATVALQSRRTAQVARRRGSPAKRPSASIHCPGG